MTLNGTLEDFSPEGILRVLSSDARTGAVRFSGDAGCTVYLHGGQLYFARDEHTDDALAAALVRPGRLTADDWTRTVKEAGDRPAVGELLVRHDVIDSSLLASIVLSIMLDPLIALFRRGEGDFEFEPDAMHWLGPYRTFRIDVIVAEVRRRVREADEWASVMPTLDFWVDARRTLPGDEVHVRLLREDWELITALSQPRSLDDLASTLGWGRYATARIVYRLNKTGLVEVTANSPEGVVVPLRPIVEQSEPELDPDLDPDNEAPSEPGFSPAAGMPPVPGLAPADESPPAPPFAAADRPPPTVGRSRRPEPSWPRGDAAQIRKRNAAWLDELYTQHVEECRAKEDQRRREVEAELEPAHDGEDNRKPKKVGAVRRFFIVPKKP